MNIDSQIRRGLVSLALLLALAVTVGSHAHPATSSAKASTRDALEVCALPQPGAPTAGKLQWRNLLPAALPVYRAK